MTKNLYSSDFYKNRDAATSESAHIVLGHVLGMLPPIRSVVDLGCGVGAWLRVIKENFEVEDVLGIDGDWVDMSMLSIPRDCFRSANLGTRQDFSKRYDLAISLECAEHIEPGCAPAFVSSLVEAANFVLFSAAIPGQGGVGHVNEQWPSYWANLFRQHHYQAFDCVRPALWQDERVSLQYRQNTILFVKDSQSSLLSREARAARCVHDPLPLVHPALFESKLLRLHPSILASVRLVVAAVKRRLWRKAEVAR